MKQLGRTYTLRFDTKRQLDEIRKAAKTEKRSINYFIIRESLKAAQQVIQQQQSVPQDNLHANLNETIKARTA